jgi:7,8-dihydropterin-6-yl-methyl-4-(beta-D-ribofuranosyl)aminobenzene 5'-phosphate synthase
MDRSRQPSLSITLVVDNSALGALRSEHGFAAWVELPNRRLLFDTGQAALCENAAALGIDLSAADLLVLSHGHFDHTGGLPALVEQAPGVCVYLNLAATGARYSIRDGKARSIGMPDDARAALETLPQQRVVWTTDTVELQEGVGLTGSIPRRTDFEDPGGPFFIDTAGTRADPIPDDQALWLRTDRGLVVLVGCSHAGLINTLRHAQRLSGEPRLHAVIGGFHLVAASDARLQRTVEALEQLDLDLIVPCHCTGEAATEVLRQSLGERVVAGAAGASFTFGVQQ